MTTPHKSFAASLRLKFPAMMLGAFALAAAPCGRFQAQAQSTEQQTQPSGQTQPAGQQAQTPSQSPVQAGPAAGGPNANSGVIAIPKKTNATAPPAPPAPPAPSRPPFKNPKGLGNITLHMEVPEVTVNVGVLLQKTHTFVNGLKESNFRVYENGKPQNIIAFHRVQAPITALLLCEFAARGWPFRIDMLNAAWAFTQQLRPQDWVAMMTFDLNTHLISDFTQNKQQIQEGINELANEVFMPVAFSETNLFDALAEALDRLSLIHGQKYIILIASGIDTMSKLDLDQILKRVKASRNITIFSISTGGMIEEMTEGEPGMMAGMRDVTFLQAENQMRTFASLTGGMWFDPVFVTELPDDMRLINESIRSKYQLVYQPTDTKQDGTWRKIRVELVDNEGQPLRMQDRKHKPLKYELIYRSGYYARPAVE
jgi:VWFA-related protein